jgi:hypothetical protein
MRIQKIVLEILIIFGFLEKSLGKNGRINVTRLRFWLRRGRQIDEDGQDG